jgi:ribosomal subunit interface protein
MPFRIHFQDLPPSEPHRDDCEERVTLLREQFPETSKYEVTLTHNGSAHEAHVHVTGKDLELASSGQHHGLHEAIVDAFDKVSRQLRKHRDKQIFSRRREAQKNNRPR